MGHTFTNFYNHATADQKHIIAGIQYYYESKTACDSNRADGDVLHEVVHHIQARTDDMENTKDTMSVREEMCIPLTEQDLKLFKQDQVSPREEFHAHLAIQIAKTHGIFPSMVDPPSISSLSYRFASGDDNLKLFKWLNTMRAMTDKSLTSDQAAPAPSFDGTPNIMELSQALFDSNTGHTCWMADLANETSSFRAAAPNELLEDQWCAYDLINWHLQKYLSGRCPNPLQMIIPGEAGVGKSKTIQTITENFNACGVGSILVKAAYTGLAASIINGKMLHYVAMLPLQGNKQSAQTLKALESYW